MVDIVTSVAVPVFIKGDKGGILYNLTAIYPNTGLVPDYQKSPIDHIEFCFFCATPPPTEGPTPFPTPEPTLAPSVAPSHRPTELPTGSPTGAPTGIPTQEPTASPTAKPATVTPQLLRRQGIRALHKQSIGSISDCNPVVSSGSPLYGRPAHDAQLPPGIESVIKVYHDTESDLQGYLLKTTGPGTFDLSLYADTTAGIFKVGAAEIEVGSCDGDPDTKSSSLEWKATGNESICVSRNSTVNKIHVGNFVPRDYDDFSPNCCEPGQPCYVFVESSVGTVSCGACMD
jgi:PT repeat